MTAPSAIRLLIVDNYPLFRTALRHVFEDYPMVKIIGEAATSAHAVELAQRTNPHVILMDMGLPECDGVTTANIILTFLPEVKFLLLSNHVKEMVRYNTFNSQSMCIQKQGNPADFIGALAKLSNIPLSTGTNILIAKLTPRETEVLVHIANGLSNKEISTELNMGTRTVETHRERMMRKIDIHNTAGLTRLAISAGLTRAHNGS